MSSNGYITARAYMSYAQIPLEDVAVSQMDRDPLRYKRRNSRHRTSYRFCGGVL